MVRSPLALLVLLPAILFVVPSITSAQTEGEAGESASDPLDEVLERLSRIEAAQKQILERLNDRESATGDTAAAVGDFSPVLIRVRSEDGRPLAGYRADLRLASKADRPALAKGVSDASGMAIDRRMPYGVYNLSLNEESGWTTYLSDLVVEVGRPLELEIVAPDPASQGKLVLRSDLRKNAFANLPLGEIRTTAGSGYYVSAAPEPGSAEAKDYPTLNHGIEEIAVALTVAAVSRLEQPDGEKLEWNWTPRSPDRRNIRYLATPTGFRAFAEMNSPSARPTDGAKYFSGLGSGEQVGYAILAAVEELGDALELDVPAGVVDVNVTGIYGEASPDVLRSLDLAGKVAPPVWLSVSLQDGSQWPDKIFDAGQWEGPRNANRIVSRAITVERGEKVTASVK